MFSAATAYKLVKPEHPDDVLTFCKDFGNFYVFGFVPKGVDPEGYFGGTFYDAVNKKTGEYFMYDILSDPKAWLNSKKIDLKTLI